MSKRRRLVGSPEARRGGIYLLPNLLTTASLLSGFYSIVSSINGAYQNAAIAIIVAAVFDGLDGRVARFTGTASRFGMEYDSLCDLVGFGVAPALLAYQWTLRPYGRYGWLAAFLYVATTALRLARFNTQQAADGNKDFTGLPCPAAAGMVSAAFFFCDFLGLDGQIVEIGQLLLVYALSYLMVSTHRYRSFKHPESARAKTFQALVAMVLVVVVLATEPRVTLFVLGGIYVLSGPVDGLFRRMRRQSVSVVKQEQPIG